ncbi:MAG: sugar ABC transporter ATP-binding protein [Ruminococcaceae bacterium]|nr:sugar ABC transporter ATP-binding protein [Oscillospiraceae bacterium]
MTDYILELKNITKTFPGVRALDNVHLQIAPGEVHALCGENGAGKSTLMKIISGAQKYTSGEILVDGKSYVFESTSEAQNVGISMIYQEFNLVPHLSVAENIFLGRLKTKNGAVQWKQIYNDANEILEKLGLDIDPHKTVSSLSVAHMQMVEIAKCLSINARVIIMDEPTAALTDEEIRVLFDIIASLKKQGISIIYISHRMDEIFTISDTITVFRDGKYIKTLKTQNTNYDELVSLMVGQSIEKLYPDRAYQKGEVVLDVKNLVGKAVNDVSFQLYKGEILGICGLLGAGNIELSKIIYGATRKTSGSVIKDGREIKCKDPYTSIKDGIGLVPDDRKNDGLVLMRSVKENISLSSLKGISTNGFIISSRENTKVANVIEALSVKVPSPEHIVGNLSGGNQQKVVFAKVLQASPDILILDEPTRGVDVGAKAEIYQIIDLLTKKGKSIILISSDLPEVIGMCDRILVMKEGKIVKEVLKSEATQEIILSYAAGGVV